MKTMHVIQHVSFEGPAGIARWAEQHHFALRIWRQDLGEGLPALGAEDWLVVMGGPMGVDDVETYPWLQAEMDFVQQVLTQTSCKVLGICLGAQVIAHALGAQISRNAHAEVGWFPIETASAWKDRYTQALPERFQAMHWHGQTFSLPAQAEWLGSSAACVHQGFLWQQKVLALQFHLEVGEPEIGRLIEHAGADLQLPGPWVMPEAELREHTKREAAESQKRLFFLLDFFESLTP